MNPGQKDVANYHKQLLEMRREYGDIFREQLPWNGGSVVHIFDPGQLVSLRVLCPVFS